MNNTKAKERVINKKGYVLIHMPDYKNSYSNGYILEHRYIMEQHLGRDLLPDEDVHHINEIKTDNRVENLEVISHSEHAKRHNRNKKGI